MASEIDVATIVDRIVSDEQLRSKLRSALGVDEPVQRSDVRAILESIDRNTAAIQATQQELKRQGDELKRQGDELKAQREEMKALREQTMQEFDKVWSEMKAQREAMEEGFTKMWEEMKALRESQDRLHRRMDKHETFWKSFGGEGLELYSLTWFKGVLEAKGYKSENLQWRVKFKDPNMTLGTPEVEVDIFQEDPLIAAEVTTFLKDVEKLLKFIKKVRFLEKHFRKKPSAIMIAYRVARSIEDVAEELARSNNIHLLTIGRKSDPSAIFYDD